MDARRRVRLLSVTLGLAIAAGPLAAPTATAVTLVADPERNSNAVVGWGWHNGKTAATINSWISSSGQRPIDIEVDTPTASSPTFSVAYVANSGAFARTSFWYPALTSSQVGSYLTTNGARLIDLEPYVNGAGALRFAAIMVKNTGAAQKSWWWYTGQTTADIAAKATSLGARPIDIDRYVHNGATRFSVVFIKNTGVDAKGWGHLYNASLSSIVSNATTNNMRILQLERIPGSTNYDAVLQSAGSEKWWYASAQSATNLGYFASQKGARLYKVEPYTSGGTKYFTGLFIDVSNAETRRIRDLVAGKMSGSWGFYLKKVGGSEVVGLQPDRVFEPASMLKILHAVRALREDQGSSTISPTTKITWYANPDEPTRYPTAFAYDEPTEDGDPADKDVCAYDDEDGTHLTSVMYSDNLGSVIIDQMLKYSDNRTTDALTRRYGFASLNSLADLAGMTKTQLNHRIGCPRPGSPQPWKNNELTLRDAGRIYEQVENLTLLDQTRRDLLYTYLIGGSVAETSELGKLIIAEAANANFTSTERGQFLVSTMGRSKGGGYTICPATGDCDPPWIIDGTVGGIIWIPFKNSTGSIVRTAYVFGRFYNISTTCTLDQLGAGTCTAINNARAGMKIIEAEMFRQVIRQAMATW